ncbi:MAG: DUF6151 family protein [Pseudomonadota bacterium]
MAGRDLIYGCRCGKLRGLVRGVSPGYGTHCMCYCKDCQRFARHLEADWVLDDDGGTALYQTVPSRIEFTQGQEKLACLRFSPKGPHRWYAGCCNTPLANTVGPGLRFAGTFVAAYPDIDAEATFGAVTTVVNVPKSLASDRVRNRGLASGIIGLLWRHVRSGFGAGKRASPFFGPDGRAVVKPEIVAQI